MAVQDVEKMMQLDSVAAVVVAVYVIALTIDLSYPPPSRDEGTADGGRG